MSILTAHLLSKEFGPDEIFSGISVEIPRKARIALVGPNGAGKTTLIQILIGSEPPTTGTVTRARGLRIGFLPQRPHFDSDRTLWAEMMDAFQHLRAIEDEIHELSGQLDDPSALERYGELQERFEEAGGYVFESRARGVLLGIGFSPEDHDRPLNQFSGGQKTRALLARLLLEAPDLLVLDEPTNHLDIDAVEWLESFLKDFSGAVLVVSHDRYFMDEVATTIWEMDFGELDVYRGNYSAYLKQRGERYERLQKEYEAQQAAIAKEEDYIRRNIAGQNTKQAQGRRRRLERLLREPERYGLVKRPRVRQTMKLNIISSGRSGDRVLITRGLIVGYQKPLFTSPDLILTRGETAALIGPNGAGKSTFLKTILGQLQALAGESRLGANVQVGYFAQAHESLNSKNTILDELLTVRNLPLSEARDYLARFLFQGDDVYRNVDTLSGGERGRLALAKLALAGANFLLLDEPTNHLDIASQEILQEVLDEFEGTILLVSHDRYLVDALATQIWEARAGAMSVFRGSYTEFAADRFRQRQEAAAQAVTAYKAAAKQQSSTNGSKKNAKQLQQQIAAVEDRIHQLETQMKQITAAIEQSGTDAGKIRTLGVQYAQAETDLHAAMAEWEALVEQG